MTTKYRLDYQSILHDVLAKAVCKHLVVAYSGGIDSSVLLYLLHQISKDCASLQVSAVHVNHGISYNAENWEEHCKSTCLSLNIPLHIINLPTSAITNKNRESVAREARYQALKENIGPEDALLTAHQENDQAETLLLQLLRGSGLAGIASMPKVQAFGSGIIFRPLLEYNRSAIYEYASRYNIKWIDDDSNEDVSLDRNYIRHCVMPAIKERWPSADTTISRTARHSANAIQLVQVLAKQDYVKSKPVGYSSLAISNVRKLSSERQCNVIRYWIQLHNKRTPSLAVLNRILNESITADEDRNPLVDWDNTEVRRYQDYLYIMERLPPLIDRLPFALSMSKCVLPLGDLCISYTRGFGIKLDLINDANIEVRFRRGGESIRLYKHRRPVKDILRESGIPPWLRNYFPLFYVNDQLAGLPGIGVDASWAAQPEEDAIGLCWRLPCEIEEQGLVVAQRT